MRIETSTKQISAPSQNDHSNLRRRWAVTFAASLLWLGGWRSIPGAFAVWVLLFGVYVVALSIFGLFLGPKSIEINTVWDWRSSFLRTAEWFVLSGFLSIVYAALYFIALTLAGHSPFPQ